MNFYQKIRFSAQIRLCIATDNLAMQKAKIRENTLLIIRTDAIGDYLLFRNFLEIIRKSPQYKNYHITLVGNAIWKDLTQNFDSNFVDECIWIDRKKFFWNINYRYALQKKISQMGFSTLLHPVFSDEFLYGYAIAKVAKASQSIGNQGDGWNIIDKEKKQSQNYFNQILPCPDENIFEFERNKLFFENLLGTNINLKKPFLEVQKINFEKLTPQNYAIIFPSASTPQRRWAIPNFVEIAQYLHQKYGLEIVLAGANSDADLGKKFLDLAHFEVHNWIGKTSLTLLASLIAQSALLITNETSAIHLAAATQSKAICVSNNTWHFGRFNPYPEKMQVPVHYIFPPQTKNLSPQEIREKYPYKKILDINSINTNSVIQKINEIMDN